MTVDPLELLEEEPSEKLKTAIEAPESVNLRPNESENLYLYPDHIQMREAIADLGNDNITVRYNLQSSQEKYVCLISNPEISLVESHAEVADSGKKLLSVSYYAVTDQRSFLKTDFGYKEVENPAPVEVAEITPELYQQAIDVYEENSFDEEDKPVDYETPEVPPPEEEFTD